MITKSIYIGKKEMSFSEKEVKGKLIHFDNENYYKIFNSDAMRPFFMSIVSFSDHWMHSRGDPAGRRRPYHC